MKFYIKLHHCQINNFVIFDLFTKFVHFFYKNLILKFIDNYRLLWYNKYVMEVQVKNNDIILKNVRDFNLTHIFECGQAFRFNKTGENEYTGVAKGHALTISQVDNEVILHDTSYDDYCNIWHDYFDLSTDYGAIKEAVAVDHYMREAINYGYGIRILKQDLWETIISFIISASNNVGRIKGIVERLCIAFGEEIEYRGKVYYSFPTPHILSSLTKDKLGIIRAGFRDKYIIDAYKKITDNQIRLDTFGTLTTQQAKSTLMSINGIGEKVSNCILLFGLGRTDSFPVDVWIKRIMEYCYFDGEQSISAISNLAKEKFGEFGGYAQQYLFYWAREKKIGI